MPDGSVSGGTETCKSLCAAGSYELSCSSGPAGVLTPIPSPDPSLGCSDIGIPTPGNWLYFVTEKNGVTKFSATLAGLGG